MTKEAMIRSLARRQYLMKAAAQETPPVPGQPPYSMPGQPYAPPPYSMPPQPPATSQPSFATRMGDFARKGLRSVGNMVFGPPRVGRRAADTMMRGAGVLGGVVLGPGAMRGAGAVGRRAAGAVRDARHALERSGDQHSAWPYNFSRPFRAPAPYLR